MPARYREIGPEVSGKIAAVLRRERDARGWSRNGLSQALEAEGFVMKVTTIRHIENGVTVTAEESYQRLITVDELRALIIVLGPVFARDCIAILVNGVIKED